MNTDIVNYNIQNRNWAHGNKDNKFLFIDLKIVLKGELHWDGDLITQATLTLYNIDSEHTYKICGVSKCAADVEYKFPYILIHLAKDGSAYKSIFTASSSDLGSLSLPVGGEAHLLFKIHNSCPKTFTCGFGPDKPNSKDGSIIICI